MRDQLERILSLLRCPECGQPSLQRIAHTLQCAVCGQIYDQQAGFVRLLAKRDQGLAAKAFGKLAAKAYDLSAARGGVRKLFARSFADEVRAYTCGFELQPDDIVVDVGCGTGNYTLAFAEQAYEGVAVGIDISAAMLELFVHHTQAHNWPNVIAIQASAENLPFRDAALKKMFNGCLHHLSPRMRSAIAEAYRCLQAGGVLYGVANLAARSSGMRWLQQVSLGRSAHPVDPDQLAQELSQAGFGGVEVDAARFDRFFFGSFRAVKPQPA